MRRRSAVAIALAATSVLLAGCSSPGPPPAPSASIRGLRTDADGRGLVASYIGGMCDGPAQLVVRETASRIDVSVVIGPDPQRHEVCLQVGYARTVAARLARPLGTRTIWSGDRRQIPFDGARLLVSTDLPPGFGTTAERGTSSDPSTGPTEADVTSGWSTSYSAPDSRPLQNRCRPGRGDLVVRIGSAAATALSSDWSSVGKATVGSAAARLYREGGRESPGGLAYTWALGQSAVQVSTSTGCEGDRILSPAELLGFARSLKPV